MCSSSSALAGPRLRAHGSASYSMPSSVSSVVPTPSSRVAMTSHRKSRAEAVRDESRSRRFAGSPADESWPGQEPTAQDQERLQSALKRHKEMHTLEDAAYSVQEVHDLLKEFEAKGAIPNKNAMQICLQHCFLKSASFCAEHMCFAAANFALSMMERHKCRFELSTVVHITMSISLRAAFANVVAFVRRLVRKTLTHLTENERLFMARHMIFALAERKESVEESLHRAGAFADKGLRIDWDNSSAQEFHLYNLSDGGSKYYKPAEGYGFAQKGLVGLLSMELEVSTQRRFQYDLQRDGAIVDVIRTNDGEPLVVRMRTQVTIPFTEDTTYRLDNMDVCDLQVKRIMESLRVLGRDPHPQCARFRPNPYLCQMLCVPPEEPYVAQICLQPKVAPLAGELDLNEYGNEPIRVKSIGSGAFLEWNLTNPCKAIHVGDRILKVNDASDKESVLEEIQHAHQWSKYELNITFMRKVKAHERGLQIDVLLPNAKCTEELLAREGSALGGRLNSSQMEAVKLSSTRRLALIQGPPGTGKTTTAVELLAFLLEQDIVPTPILVSGHTNAAVDNILVGLAKKGKRVVRIGEESKVRLECKPYLLGEERAAEPVTAEVICATCSGSGGSIFQKEGIICHTVLIDEGSQATESSCLIPLCHGAQHLILVGDQCQLEPFVKSEYARSEHLGLSLFNRFCQQGVVPTMLNTQYRMNPLICEFPSQAFYSGQLLSGVGHLDRMPTFCWQWPSRLNPVCFIDAKEGFEASSEEKIEKKNEHEVSLVLAVLRELMHDPELSVVCEDGTFPVGIVTPYAAQKESIMRELERCGFLDAAGKHLVEVNSVDGFQGREKDIIIFSAVRANDEGSVGFLHDWRRINVMLTRAKHGLIIIGHRETLQTDFYWNQWLRWAAMRGCIMGEAAHGNWAPRCLVEDEWIMKTQVPDISSSSPEPCQSKVKLWLDDNFAVDASNGSWEDLDTSSEGPAEGDLEPSEASFYSLSEFESEQSSQSGVVESWEDLEELEATSLCGPLDKLIRDSKDRDAGAGCWEDLLAESIRRAHATGDRTDICTIAEPEDTGGIAESVTEDEKESSCDCLNDSQEQADNTLLDLVGFSLVKEGQELPEDSVMEQIPQPLPLERLETGSWFDCSAYHSQQRGVEDAPINAETQMAGYNNALEMHVVWMPIIYPMPAINYPMPACVSSSSESFLPPFQPVLQPQTTSIFQSNHDSQAQLQHSLPTSQAHAAQEVLLQKCAPRSPTPGLKGSFDSACNAHNIIWHADGRKLQSNDRSIISPAFDISLNKPQAVAVFKLMITSKGNGFSKSRGVGLIKLKCESDLREELDANFTFSLTVGGETHGPVAHDFSSQATADILQQAIRFSFAVDPVSKTVPIYLEVSPTCKDPLAPVHSQTVMTPSLASGECAGHFAQDSLSPKIDVKFARLRCRSEAGQQRQHTRWWSRLRERSRTKRSASVTSKYSNQTVPDSSRCA